MGERGVGSRGTAGVGRAPLTVRAASPGAGRLWQRPRERTSPAASPHTRREPARRHRNASLKQDARHPKRKAPGSGLFSTTRLPGS
jgi:hypothetical protein